jgi:hypothetical protein
MNVIFGSGIVGLLAKFILGPSWKIVPFYKSRFFSWNPALDDNFIIYDEQIIDVIKELSNIIGKPPAYPYKRAWSIGGQVMFEYDQLICADWLRKIFGSSEPSQVKIYMSKRLSHQVFDVRVNELYSRLMERYLSEIREESAKGQVTEIGQNYYVRNGQKENFEKAVSTIPLNALLRFMGIENDLQSKNIHYVHVQTEDLNFEGANQLLVADLAFDFFKVSNIAQNRYLFYFQNDVVNYGMYLMPFMKQFEILDGTSIQEAIPLGEIPKLDSVEKAGIFCVGSYAEWDWCADVGSNILKLVRYNNRNNTPQKMKSLF